jgi:hypothetical protein
MARRWLHRRVNGVDVAEPYIAFARSRAASGHPIFELAEICSLPYVDDAFAAAIAQLVLNFVPDPRGACRNVPGEAAGRNGSGCCLGLSRRACLSANVLGHRRRTRPGCCRRARSTVFGAAGIARWPAKTVRQCRACQDQNAVSHNSHGLRKFRRLLAPTVWRPRTGRHLCGANRARAVRPNRGGGSPRLSCGSSRWAAFANGNRLADIGDGSVTLEIERGLCCRSRPPSPGHTPPA